MKVLNPDFLFIFLYFDEVFSAFVSRCKIFLKD